MEQRREAKFTRICSDVSAPLLFTSRQARDKVQDVISSLVSSRRVCLATKVRAHTSPCSVYRTALCPPRRFLALPLVSFKAKRANFSLSVTNFLFPLQGPFPFPTFFARFAWVNSPHSPVCLRTVLPSMGPSLSFRAGPPVAASQKVALHRFFSQRSKWISQMGVGQTKSPGRFTRGIFPWYQKRTKAVQDSPGYFFLSFGFSAGSRPVLPDLVPWPARLLPSVAGGATGPSFFPLSLYLTKSLFFLEFFYP